MALISRILCIKKILLLMAPIFFFSSVNAQNIAANDLISKWERLASRADEVLEKSQASNDTLKIILSDLLQQRKEVYEKQVLSKSKISNLSEELEALGPPPEEGFYENETIGKRRLELNNLIADANVPFVISRGMLKRTDFLIRETNTVLRGRLTQRLFSFGASPFDTKLWMPALGDLKSFFTRIIRETSEVLKSDTQRTLFFQKIPIIILLLTVAIFLFFVSFKRLFYGTFNFVTDSKQVKITPVIGFFLRSLNHLSLLFSALLIIQALKFSGLFGFNGTALVNSIIPIAVILVCARWFSEILCHDKLKLQGLGGLVVRDGLMGAKLVGWLGLIYALTVFLEHLTIAGSWSVGTQVILNFPLLILASIFLFRLFGLLRYDAISSGTISRNEPNQIKFQLPIQMQSFLRLVTIIAPILAAAGYLYAAQKLVYPIILSLGLIAFSSIIFAIFYSIFDSLSEENLENDTKTSQSRWALIPVLMVIILGSLNIPIIALIWGAEGSDIHEIWLRLNEGIPLGSARVTLPGLISLVVIFCLGFALTRLIQRVLRTSVLPKTTLDTGGRNALVSGVGYAGIILSTMVAISSTGLDLSSLAIVAGALSVGLGFGLQTIVSNFVSGVILLIERPIKEGDWIEVAGFSGTVRKISVRSTQIQTFDRGTVIVPNSELISGSVLNYTHSNSMGRVRVPVGVAYGTDPRRVEAILLEIATNHPQVLKDPGPSVVFMGFGPDSIDFEIRAFMKDVGYVLAIKSEMNYEITEAFKKEGIEIPFAQRDINIKNFESLKAAFDHNAKNKLKGA